MYCTGLSMGGFGTWQAATLDLFAAVAPVCASGSAPSDLIPKSTPVWAFHGANDVLVPVSYSDGIVELLRQGRFGENGSASASGTNAGEVKYTRYEESPAPVGFDEYCGHASWIQAYAEPELFRWLLSHRREDVL
jgi:predicted peptidase